MRMSKTTEAPRAPNDDDDLDYVVLCQRGDTESFSVLVARHSKKMLSIAYRMLGDYDEACDITQEAFLAAFRSIGKFKAEAKFSTWLYRIVVNHTKNRLKQRQGLAKHEGASLDEIAGGQGECRVCVAEADKGHPGEILERRELDAAVQKCISALEVDYREVLVMRDIQGFSYEEIRGIMRIPEGTVKSRLSRARLAMKDCLKKVMGDL